MRSSARVLAVILGVVAAGGCKNNHQQADETRSAGPTAATDSAQPTPPAPTDLAERATMLAHDTILFDGHIDMPYRLVESAAPDGSLTEDVSKHTAKGQFDYVRAREGGLDGAFFAAYIPAELQSKPGASKKKADQLIDLIESLATDHPAQFALARTPEDVKRISAENKVALAIGIENGSALETDLANVQHFYDRGVRYITLTHSGNNAIGDSSYSEERTNHGLSDFGKKVIAEMNRVGVIVDVSHVTDETFADVMKVSKVPVIASHSSLRHFTPGFERNMSDEMVKQLGDAGGVVMINFGSWFVSQANRDSGAEREKRGKAWAKEHGLSWDDENQRQKIWEHMNQEMPPVRGTVEDIADHIDRAVKLAGIDHVGLGSDFDGVMVLPTEMDDVSMYPNLIRVLLERGYSDQAIAKLCSENVFRVWHEVAAYAAQQHGAPQPE